jgi:SNF2 family DNA or RNA helicase
MKPFATTTELLPHQIAAVEKMLPTRVGALFMDMGTGKSRTAIELVKIRARKIDKAIWFCPVSLKETVRQEIIKHTDCRDVHVFNDKTDESNVPKARWYVVGIESMSSSNRVVATVNKLVTERTMVICDESSYIKGHRAKRTERITYISSRAKYRLALTGTPISQGVVDLFAQMRFLSPKILGYRSFYSFAANHLEYSDKYPGMIVRSHNLGYLAAKIQPYVYQVTKDECLTLPDKLYEYRGLFLTPEQLYWYEHVKVDIINEIDRRYFSNPYYDQYLTSLAIFRMFTALQQVTSGFLKWDGERHTFPTRRPEALINVIRDIPANKKILIFCKFQYDVDQIKNALTAEFGADSVASFDGRDSEKRRREAETRFRDGARFLVVTQSIAGHGFNFQDVASYAVFYNNGFKYSERLQAEDRLHRIGQTQKVTYIDLYCSCGIEQRIDRAIQEKADAIQTFKQEVDKVKDKKVKLKDLIKAL